MPRKQQNSQAAPKQPQGDGWDGGESTEQAPVTEQNSSESANAAVVTADGKSGSVATAPTPTSANSQEPIANSQREKTEGTQGTKGTKEPEKLTGEAARKAQIEARVAEDVARNAPVPTEPNETMPSDPIQQALRECDALCEQCEGNVMKAYELVNQIRAISPRSKLDKAIKAAVLERASKFCFEMQQGLPQVRMDANTLAKEPALRTAGVQEERIELRARGDKDIADLRDENLRLKKLLENQGQGQEQE